MHRFAAAAAAAVLVLLCTCTLLPDAHAAKTAQKKAAQRARTAEEEGEAVPTSARARIATIAKAPYLGAILMDAATGAVLFEDNADAPAYPASIVKLMTMLIILEQVQKGSLSLQDTVTVSAAAARIGGSQVYLKEGETFSVEDLLYALIVQSANDAAVALALHIAGTTDAFVDMMNQKARAIGMTATVFHSVHGLPPGRDQQPDTTTARDIAKLCRMLLNHPDALRYTGIRERTFRANAPEPFIMRTHNHLLGSVEGCDGFKTGYYRAAGYSIAATAAKRGVRAIAVVMGSVDRKQRDAKARELLARGLAELVRALPPPPPLKAVAPIRPAPEQQPSPAAGPDTMTRGDDSIHISKRTLRNVLIAFGVIVLGLIVVSLLKNIKRKSTTL